MRRLIDNLRGPTCAGLVLGLLPACADSQGRPDAPWTVPSEDGDGDTGGAAPLDLQPLGLDEVFAAAGEEFDVPPEILAAIAWVETRWTMIDPDIELAHDHGRPLRYGLMGMTNTRLDEGASLAGVDAEVARTDPSANVRAAAAWLSARADAGKVEDRDNLSQWADVIAEFPEIEILAARSGYVYDEIYATMRKGFVAETATGEIQGGLDALEVWPEFDVPPPLPALQAGPDYADSVWRPSPNTSSRPSGAKGTPTLVIIHTCEGSYNGCWSWLTNSSSGVSAHYVVNADGSQVSQLARESKKGWHISAKYACSRNGGHHCNLDGTGSNSFTIGIEHAGSSSQSHWDDGLLHASAKLVCDITRDQGIARDEFHVVGHGQLQPYNRSDPGSHWPWAGYLELVDQYCGDVGGGVPEPDPEPEPDPGPTADPPSTGFDTIVVDSNNANNVSGRAMVAVSNAWTSANSAPGHYGTGYWYGATGSSDDPAVFWFYLDEPGEHAIEAWWTAGTNRAPDALFRLMDGDGNVIGESEQNQQSGGQSWRDLGTYTFGAGWNAVQLSRNAAAGNVVIADAIRVR